MIFEETKSRIVAAVQACEKQPLPSEIFENLKYDIEQEDGDKIYAYIREEILSMQFLEWQKLNGTDLEIVLYALNIQRTQFKEAYDHVRTLHVPRWTVQYYTDLKRVEQLIEKVELIMEGK